MTHISNTTQITQKSGREIAIYSIHNNSFHSQRVKKIRFCLLIFFATRKKIWRPLVRLFEAFHPKLSMGTPWVALLSLIVLLVVLLLVASHELLVALALNVLLVLQVFRVLRVLHVLHVSLVPLVSLSSLESLVSLGSRVSLVILISLVILVSLVSLVFPDLLNIWKIVNHSLPDSLTQNTDNLKSRDRKRCDI